MNGLSGSVARKSVLFLSASEPERKNRPMEVILPADGFQIGQS